MKILLVSLQTCVDTIGLKCLHYYLLSKGFDSRILYLQRFNIGNKKLLENIKRFILDLNPGLIGFSLMSIDYKNTCIVTKHIKTFLPKVPIVWGGIHPTLSPESCLQYADYVCVGEGEQSILAMAKSCEQRRKLNGINNICYLENDVLIQNDLHPEIENLDNFPQTEHIPVQGYMVIGNNISKINRKEFRKHLRWKGISYSLTTSRGCPFSCTYCCNNMLSNLYGSRKIRRHSIDFVMEELKIAVAMNPELEIVNIQDECFISARLDYIEAFCKEYKKHINLPFVVRALPALVTEEKILCLKKAGLAWIAAGLQSGSDRVCKDIYNRPSFKKDFIKAAEIVRRHKVAAFYDIILDNPLEVIEDHIETINTLMEAPKPFYPQFLSLSLYYGTELYARAKKECSPSVIENYMEKNINIPHKTDINKMLRLAVFISPKHMARIVELYRRKPSSLRFRFLLVIYQAISALIIEPITYFRVLKLSYNNSVLKTISRIPVYLKEGLIQYYNQFIGK